jgi:16S rRNA G966 N2-methylase RsmD
MNRLYFGDNLRWLSDRKEFPDAGVDLVYLDPPFNSNADYNVLFREPSGQVSQAQFHAMLAYTKSAIARTRSPARGTRALPRTAEELHRGSRV